MKPTLTKLMLAKLAKAETADIKARKAYLNFLKKKDALLATWVRTSAKYYDLRRSYNDAINSKSKSRTWADSGGEAT